MSGICDTIGREERCIRSLVRKPEVKRQLWTHRHEKIILKQVWKG